MMTKITWLELYNFLHERANNIHAAGTFDWSSPVVIYDAELGEKYYCDTYYIDDGDKGGLVLATRLRS